MYLGGRTSVTTSCFDVRHQAFDPLPSVPWPKHESPQFWYIGLSEDKPTNPMIDHQWSYMIIIFPSCPYTKSANLLGGIPHFQTNLPMVVMMAPARSEPAESTPHVPGQIPELGIGFLLRSMNPFPRFCFGTRPHKKHWFHVGFVLDLWILWGSNARYL